MRVAIYQACDRCGRDRQDTDEMLCRVCKPVLAERAAIRDARDAIDAAYWRFERCARALPPVLAVPEAYELLARLGVRHG